MREQPRQQFRLPSVTVGLLVVNVAVFVLQSINAVYFGWPFEEYLALSRRGLQSGYVWQLFTFQFLHANSGHLLANSLGLYFLGRPVEDMLGKARLLEVYFGSSFLGGLLQALLGVAIPAYFGGPVLGASAGVCGLLAAFALLLGDRTILLMFFLPVRARTLLNIALAMAVFFVLVPAEPGIAHAAHLGGLLGGMAYMHWIVRRERRLFDWRDYRARSRDRELVVTPARSPAPRKRREKQVEEELPPGEFISREVDPILEKISAHGIQSLTERERKILERARAKMMTR